MMAVLLRQKKRVLAAVAVILTFLIQRCTAQERYCLLVMGANESSQSACKVHAAYVHDPIAERLVSTLFAEQLPRPISIVAASVACHCQQSGLSTNQSIAFIVRVQDLKPDRLIGLLVTDHSLTANVPYLWSLIYT